jgi:LCP family protein required for cell wall assembly
VRNDGRNFPGDELPPLPARLNPRGRGAGRARSDGRRASRSPRGVRLARLIAALLSFSLLAASGYAWASYQHLISGVTTIDAVPGSQAADKDGSALNILLIGDDHRPANASPALLQQLSTQQDGGGVNTDTMILLHIPAHGAAPTAISFPRDSWVDIPGYGKGKLNSAFSKGAASGGGDAGGIKLLIRTLQNLTGLTVDHFVRVSLLGFYDIANALGPIQVCLKEPAKDPYSGVDLPAGVSTLNAKQALSFVRQRHNLPRGDLDREVRQQYFLSAELHKVVSAGTLVNPAKQQKLISAVSSAMQIDPKLDLLDLATRMQGVSPDKVTFATIPITGTPTIQDANGNDVSIVALDFAAIPAFINKITGGSDAYTKATAASPGSVTVSVVNGSGTPGLAAANSTALSGLGFKVTAPANGTSQTATTITYPAGMEAQAKAVAAHVPGAAVSVSTSVQGVTLTLGTDGHQVAAAGGSSAGSSSGAGTAGGSSAAPASSSAPGVQTFNGTSCIN